MALYRTRINWTFPVGSGGGTSTWHLRTTSLPGAPADQAQVDLMMLIVEDFYQGAGQLMGSNTVVSWDGTALEIATGSPILLSGGVPWTFTGTGASTYGPTAAMAVVTWRTTLANRRGRGRTFIGPLPTGAIGSDGTLDTLELGQLRTAATALVGASSGIGVPGSIVVWSEADGVGRDLTGSSVTDQCAVLRSRRG